MEQDSKELFSTDTKKNQWPMTLFAEALNQFPKLLLFP
jgi:hypothetical protein